MRLIVTGASGFAGGEVLRQASADPDIEKILLLTRRTVGSVAAKVEERIHETFLDYSGVDFRDWDACIWCLGVSQTAVSEARYVEITHDYAVRAASAMFAANPNMRFCFVSGRGADPTEQATRLFGRIKGRTERALAVLSPRVTSFRPAYIKPTRATGPRRDAARYLAPIGTVLSWISDDLSVDCDQLARCLIGVARHGSLAPMLDNRAIRAWTAPE